MDSGADLAAAGLAAAGGGGGGGGVGSCPCCSSSAVATWRRSVKRKLDAAEGKGEGEGVAGLARVEAEEEAAALREAVAAAQETAAALRAEVEEERLAAASAASEAMAMMLRLQREKAEVQMEHRQFRRFADEKMALDADELAHLHDLLARRARAHASLRSRVRAYRLQFHHLGIPIPEEDVGDGTEEDDLLEDDGEGGYYPELRCFDEDYYEDGEEREGGEVVLDLERRICRLEHDDERAVLSRPLQEGAHLYAGEALLEASVQERSSIYADEALPEVSVPERSHLYADEDLPESAAAGYSEEEEEGENKSEGSSSVTGSDRVYTIDKVHQGVAAPAVRVPEERQEMMVEPDIKKLYMRLEALEADRESMRQTLVAMRTEKAQLMLLREIAQQLAKDGAASATGVGVVPVALHLPIKRVVGVADRRVGEDKKKVLVRTFSMVALFKWILTFFCSKKNKPSRYTFGLSSSNVGLLMLLDKCPRIQKTLSRTK